MHATKLLQAASLNALLRHLTEDVATATQEGPAFLLSFRTVVPAFAVLSRLLERYRGVTAATASNAEKTRVRDAVAALVAFWVESYPEDFTDQALLRMLADLNRLVEREPTSPGAMAQLQEACVRHLSISVDMLIDSALTLVGDCHDGIKGTPATWTAHSAE